MPQGQKLTSLPYGLASN